MESLSMPNKRQLFATCLWFAGCACARADEDSLISLAQALSHPDREARRHAAYALSEEGAKARPVLPKIILGLDDEDEQVWAQCAATIAKIGPEAKAAIPRLAKDLSGGSQRYGEQVAYRSAFALSRIGVASLPVLRETLSTKQPLARLNAVRALGWLGAPAKVALPEMAELLGDFDKAVRQETAETLAEFGVAALPALTSALRSPRSILRAESALALGLVGPEAKDMGDELFAVLLHESDVDARCAMMRALANLGFEPQALTPVLTQALLESDARVQDAAINALLRLPEPERNVVPHLTILLASGEAATRQRAANVLGRFGARAQSATAILLGALDRRATDEAERAALISAVIAPGPAVIPDIFLRLASVPMSEISENHWAVRCLRDLAPRAPARVREALRSPVPSVRYAALEAARGSRPLLSTFVAELYAATAHEEPKIRASALLALSQAKVAAVDWHPRWLVALGDPEESVRWAAMRGLMTLREEREKLAPQLYPLLRDPSAKVREETIHILGDIGPAAKSATPFLIDLLGQTPEETPRAAILACLGKIEPDPKVVLPTLVASAGQGATLPRAQALKSLGALKAGGQPGMSVVELGLRDEQPAIRAEAVQAYGRIVNDPAEAVPVFLRALDDEHIDVRRPGINGLRRLGSKGMPGAAKLIDLLANEAERTGAIEALRDIKPTDPRLFIKPLGNKEVSVRLYACEALRRIGKPAAVALPELRKLLKDEFRFVRRRAEEAIKAIESPEPDKSNAS